MVHALNEAWRVVRPSVPGVPLGPPFERGVLDIRPRPGDPRVVVTTAHGGEVRCGPLRPKPTEYDRHTASEHALAMVVEQGLFEIAAVRYFDWIDEYDTADDLTEDIDENWSTRYLDEDTALALISALDRAGAAATASVRQAVVMRFLVKYGE